MESSRFGRIVGRTAYGSQALGSQHPGVSTGNSSSSQPRNAGSNYSPMPARHRWYVKLFAWVACLFTAWHILASFLWIAPWSFARQAIPGGQATLSAYMLPMFGQSWSVFAPEPINGNYRLLVRADVATGVEGRVHRTDWIDATAAELVQWKTHHLLPPRASGMVMQQTSDFKNAREKLSAEQAAVVSSGYYTGDDARHRFEKDLRAAKPASKTTGAENVKRVEAMIKEDRELTALSTQIAKAVWGSNVETVQFEVSRQNAVPFAYRNSDTPEQYLPARKYALSGWRALEIFEGQDEQNFSKIFPVDEALKTTAGIKEEKAALVKAYQQKQQAENSSPEQEESTAKKAEPKKSAETKNSGEQK